MADGESKESSSKTSLFEDLSFLVWGPNIKEEVFKRWTQGFVFSPDEPSALVQEQGGPCAVIASVQAYILKNMLFSDGVSSTSNWRQITNDQVQSILVCSLCEMLEKAKTEDSAIKVVTLKDHIKLPSKNAECARLKEEEGEGETTSTSSKSPPESTEFHKAVCNQELHLQSSRDVHSLLSSVECESVKEARSLIERNFHIFEGLYGILLFLYSMILTRGLEMIKSEMSDPGEPLVDENFGYGSQTLINLLMTGQAVSNVWNFSKAVGGLELKGIPKQSEIGFLTILEAHRYCEVGSFLKCPIYPIWLLGSETHITVLFCIDRSLSGVESPKEEAQRVFNSFDEQENGFIESDKLSDILDKLGLETDPEYVKFMQSRLDPDSIGVILLPNFMDEFFPGESMQPQWTDPFVVYHYNGLGIKSDKSHTNKIVFIEGMACIEPTDNSNIAEEEIVTCLKTKWTGISVTWESRNPPSLN